MKKISLVVLFVLLLGGVAFGQGYPILTEYTADFHGKRTIIRYPTGEYDQEVVHSKFKIDLRAGCNRLFESPVPNITGNTTTCSASAFIYEADGGYHDQGAIGIMYDPDTMEGIVHLNIQADFYLAYNTNGMIFSGRIAKHKNGVILKMVLEGMSHGFGFADQYSGGYLYTQGTLTLTP